MVQCLDWLEVHCGCLLDAAVLDRPHTMLQHVLLQCVSKHSCSLFIQCIFIDNAPMFMVDDLATIAWAKQTNI